MKDENPSLKLDERGLVSLADADVLPRHEVGGKALNLARLRSAGFTALPGVVIPAGVEFDDDDIPAVLHHLGAGPFAVRSSGSSEDGTETSLAGQYLSVLDVADSDVHRAVEDVQRSADGVGDGPIAVLIQPMLSPVCAGVAFTADPTTGDRSTTTVVATSGLADRLVSGAVAGDEWLVSSSGAKPVRQPEGVLDKRLARRVAKTANEVAQLFGVPQDVEWVWDGNKVWVVQARPITGLPAEVNWDPPNPGVYSRSLRFGEWIPEPVTPLFESWLLTTMEKRLHQWIGEQVGQVAPEPHHVIINGWYFYSLNWLPAPGVALWSNAKSIIPRLPKTWRRASAMFPQTARYGYRLFEDEWRRDVLPRYREAVKSAEAEVESASPDRLVGIVDELGDLAGLYFASMAVVAGSGYKFESQLGQFWNKHLVDHFGFSHLVFLSGLEQSAAALDAPRLESLDWWKPPAFGQDIVALSQDLIDRRTSAEAAVEEALAQSPRKLRKWRRLLADAQKVNPVREEQVAQLSLPWPVMRRAVTRLGDHMVTSGYITGPDEVFFLTRDELMACLAGGTPPFSVASRMAQRDRDRRLRAPLTVGKIPWIVRFLFATTERAMGAARSENSLVSGVPASPGRAQGPVRIILDSSQFDEFEEGEVLVAPLTAPAWTSLFDRAEAVVTDVGNALAHASIIAREYGIPAVVGCGDATHRLRNGQMVIVDGSSGNVEPA